MVILLNSVCRQLASLESWQFFVVIFSSSFGDGDLSCYFFLCVHYCSFGRCSLHHFPTNQVCRDRCWSFSACQGCKYKGCSPRPFVGVLVMRLFFRPLFAIVVGRFILRTVVSGGDENVRVAFFCPVNFVGSRFIRGQLCVACSLYGLPFMLSLLVTCISRSIPLEKLLWCDCSRFDLSPCFTTTQWFISRFSDRSGVSRVLCCSWPVVIVPFVLSRKVYGRCVQRVRQMFVAMLRLHNLVGTFCTSCCKKN